MDTKCQQYVPIRPSLGLLTTVEQLPHNYKIRYTVPEKPLDLTLRNQMISNETNISNILSPLKKKLCVESVIESDSNMLFEKCLDTEVTPNKPIKNVSAPKTSKNVPFFKTNKHKAVRKLKFEEKKSSPVSGTIIRSLEEIFDGGIVEESGDIDPQYNIVEVTDEAKAEIAAIPNFIGAYACKLCKNEFDDAFGLASHRCSCIVLLEYRCPECDKRFNCPANLASHRRWHKPKEPIGKQENLENELQFECKICGKLFKRQAYLKKHQATHNRNHNSKNVLYNKFENLIESLHSDNSNNSINFNSVEFKFNSSVSDMCDELSSSTTSEKIKNEFEIYKSAFTEEENIAAAALAYLRNGPSVITHTTAFTL